MSDDAVAYTYVNVGSEAPVDPPHRTGVAYTYTNVGFAGIRSLVGRLFGFAAPRLLATAYTYVNVDVALEPVRHRVTEDGAPRHTEDDRPRHTDGGIP